MSIIRNYKIKSNFDGLDLGVTVVAPEKKMKGAIILVHGMSEPRTRYLEFMNYLADNGYLTIIHDQRGHGESIRSKEDYGYFYKNGKEGMIEDLNQVVDTVREQYKSIPYYLYSNSLGTLVARAFLQKYDEKIDGLVMLGPPKKNKQAKGAKHFTQLLMLFKNPHHRSKKLQIFTFANYPKRFKNEKNKSWLTSNYEELKKFKKTESYGFIFTLNGFYNLYALLEQAYEKKYQCKNNKLPIFMLAGSEDPVIGNKESFYKIKSFLENQGYQNIEAKLYKGKRHELLLEMNKKEVYQDILNFYNKINKK